MVKNIAIAVLCCGLLASCEEETRQSSKRKHAHDEKLEQQRKIDPVTQSLTFNWERLLSSGELLMGVTEAHFAEFRRAVKGGVFNRYTILSKAEIDRLGPNCTNSPQDEMIGVRRLERTLTLAPDLLVMKDANGNQLKDWLQDLKRNDLLEVVKSLKPAAKP